MGAANALLSPAHGELVEALVSCLGLELAAQQQVESSPRELEEGRLVHDQPEGGVFRFSLVYDQVVVEGAPVRLRIGSNTWQAEVLHRLGLNLLLEVRRDDRGVLPPARVPAAELLAEPWFLLQALIDGIQSLGSADWTVPSIRLLGHMTGTTGSTAAEPDADTSLDDLGLLNGEQAEAVRLASSRPVWFVWGPPGTGKTSTLGYLVANVVNEGETVLVLAQSNVAVDAAASAALEPLRQTRKGAVLLGLDRVVRAGPAATDRLRKQSISSRDIAARRNPDVARRLAELQAELVSADARNQGSEVARLARQLRKLVGDLQETERAIINDADVVFCTLSKLVITPELAARKFDAVIVDEASMVLPPQVVFAATRASERCTVFGDYQQLPPIVATDDTQAKSLLQRDVFRACGIDRTDGGRAPVTMLREQYRMHPSIREMVSEFCYRGELRDGQDVEVRTAHLTKGEPLAGSAVAWLNTARLGARAQIPASRRSRFSLTSALGSAALALRSSTEVDDVVLLAPYRAQVTLLAALVKDAGVTNLQLGTVHRFQGAEAAVVVLDLVDGVPLRIPGQLLRGSDGERLVNVGLSRAKGKLVVAAHPTLMRSDDRDFRNTRAVLQRLRRHEIPPLHGISLDHGKLELSFQQGGIEDVHADLDPGDIVAVWCDPRNPPTAARSATHIKQGPENHVVMVLGDERVIVSAQEPKGSWGTWTVRSARFANAIAQLLEGSALARTRGTESGTVVVRPDRCVSCNEPVELARAGSRVILECTRCPASRWPTLIELEGWAAMVGVGCPNCGAAFKAKLGAYGPFLACPRYPKCEHIMNPRDLIGLPVVPEEERPKPPPRGPKRRRPTTAEPRDPDGRDPRQVAEFEDYNIQRAEAGRWLDIGFTAEFAVLLLNRGVSLEEAELRRASGESTASILRDPDARA